MNEELIAVLNYMEKERGLDRDVVCEALESALLSASRKGVGPSRDLRIEIDRKTCDIRSFATVTVVEGRPSNEDEITLTRARSEKADAKAGDEMEIEVTPENFGRIAAQTAKQAILQKIRQAEKDIVFDEYKDRVGDIVSGAVRRFERSDIIVDLGRAEAILPSRERVPTEEYQIGDRVRAYVVEVQNNMTGPDIVLSRSNPEFVRRLFELEVAEIADGVVEIKDIAREPGYRTKIAIVSHDEKVDPVGACVGMRGIRVKNIVRELSGEKIDIVRWSDDVKTYVTNALSPAKLQKVEIEDGEEKVITVTTDSDQLSLAIGKRGQNVRLTSRLVGYRVDVQKDASELTFEEKVSQAVTALAAIDGIDEETASLLVSSGFLTPAGIMASNADDLAEITGLEKEQAQAIIESAGTQASENEEEATD